MSHDLLIPLKQRIRRFSSQVPLRLILVIPFLLEISLIVGLTGWFSLRKGRQAVHNLVSQLAQEKSDRIETEIAKFLEIPLTVNQITAKSVARDRIDVSNVRNLQPLFWDQLQSFPSINSIGFGDANQGNFIGVASRKTDEQTHYYIEYTDEETNGDFISFSVDVLGRMTTGRLMKENFDARDRPWYQRTIGLGHSNWSPLYIPVSQTVDNAFAITASQPIYDEQHTLLGVATVTLRLQYISTVLKQLDIDYDGQAYIVDSTGQLIGISDGTDPLSAIALESDNSDPLLRPYARNSHQSVIAESAQYLEAEFGHWSQITEQKNLYLKSETENYFLQVRLIQDNYGVRWRSVVIIPESNFMAEIEANQRLTLILCAIALMIAAGLGWLTARWLTRPLLELSEISQDIARGKRDRPIPEGGIREISQLSDSFRDMAQQLQTSFDVLEDKVAERTAQLQEAKQIADAANAAKSKFIANMSHELRTPLNGVLGYAQILMHSQHLTPLELKQLNSLYNCGNHLLNLINDILDFAKLEAGELTINPKITNLGKLLDTVIEICQVKADEKYLDLLINRSPSLPSYVRVDDKRLKQVLINLLGNAIKFTEPKGQVKFCVHPLNPATSNLAPKNEKEPAIDAIQNIGSTQVQFEIIDTGIGIDPADIERIFQPFEQVSTPDRNTDGTGLGLVIVQEILDHMGSQLQVESQLGSGSRFCFDLHLNIDLCDPIGRHGERATRDTKEQLTVVSRTVAPKELPEESHLVELLHLAKRGSLNRLSQYLDNLELENSNLIDFCHHYRQLVQGFQVRPLVDELTQDLELKSSSDVTPDRLS
ncbi:hybrid sensor histidine kinase/response regulator [Geitlerinema sp. P-1104]|uniref:hybrid sensor histidine kinase/response regulator n=1 Tax=Geitlerinema sp. P-1104 TaxID=2546230 RepID=UPI0014777107|nr:hybrid sensor histidine kinase/response regulator [Geitlerinema sp. P-1104]NMG58558.1 hybrid sensor histidine kinase/response regulator [Geitlerinema sp. P-1104]